ncbi:MAG TPA: hypothetical protein VFQ33_14060 [Xanthobacteraceae bacterium]|nr:hypothetical protein [Xanthobacteraceae bacterium]
MLTLVQTRKAARYPIVCVDRDYWTRTINFDLLLEAQVMARGFAPVAICRRCRSAWQELAVAGIQTANPRPILRTSDEGLEMMPSG